MKDSLVLQPGLLAVEVVAVGMGGSNEQFPRDQPVHVGADGAGVSTNPGLDQEFQVAGTDHAIWTQLHQLAVEVQAATEDYALPHLQGHLREIVLGAVYR